jgi:nucleoside-diphosphate-sugar epimerase
MKITILGSSSFLARHLIAQFPFEAQLKLLSRATYPPFDFPASGIAQLPIDALEADVIIYCAGAGVQPGHGQSDDLIWALNFEEPKHLIERLQANGFQGTLITFGSYFEIGITEQRLPFTEDALIQHTNTLPNAYCASKHRFTQFVAEQQTQGLPFSHVHLILTNIYGKGENESRLLPYLARQLAAGAPIALTSGDQVRQYTHVRDVARFIVERVLPRRASGIYNLSRPETMSVRDVALSFCRVADADPALLTFANTVRSDTAMPYLALNTAKLEQAFGIFDWMPLEDGLREYYQLD